VSRYHLTRELEALGFQASPFSFYHPLYEIVIEFSPSQTGKHPWTVSVRGQLLRCKTRKRAPRRFGDLEEAAQTGLRTCGVGRRYMGKYAKLMQKSRSFKRFMEKTNT
jgi:hypothetical protein